MSELEHPLPVTWMDIQLGQVIDYGSTEKVEPGAISAETWVLELEDIEKGSSKLISRKTFAERKSKSTKNRFLAGDVLYGKLRPYLNKIVVADKSGVCTTEILPLKPNCAVNGRYLFYWLKHPRFLDYVQAVSYGVNMPRLGTADGKAAPFVLAPLPEQERIIHKLDAVFVRVDACRERLNNAVDILKRFRQSVLAAATSGQLTPEFRSRNIDVDTEIFSYPLVPFEKLVISVRGGSNQVPSNDPSSFPILRSSSVRQGELNLLDVKFLTSHQSKRDSNFIENEDVLFTRLNGSAEYVGNCVVVTGVPKNTYQYPDRLFCAKLKASLDPEYCMYAFSTPSVKLEIERRAKSTAGHKRISIQDLKEIEIRLPGIAEQQAIVLRVKALFSFADRLEARLATACSAVDRLTPALLAKTFRGELVPQDPADEPASELLARLATSRATKTAKPRRTRTAKA